MVKEKVNAVLDKYAVINDPLKKVAAKTGVDKAFIAIAIAVGVPFVLYFFLTASTFLTDLIGFLYPVYGSIKAIESESKEDDTLWLTYWLVFALFKVLEGGLGFIMFSIPFYTLIKACFLVWCYYPKTQGAQLIYTSVIKSYLVPALGLKDAAKKE